MLSTTLFFLVVCPMLISAAWVKGSQEDIKHVSPIAEQMMTTTSASSLAPHSEQTSSSTEDSHSEGSEEQVFTSTIDVAQPDEAAMIDDFKKQVKNEVEESGQSSGRMTLTTTTPAILPNASAAGSSSPATRVSACFVLLFLMSVPLLFRS